MALTRRQVAVLLLLFLVAVSATAVSTSRSLKTVKDPNFHSQVIKKADKGNDLSELERAVERRMDIQLSDYPGTGANNNHDPRTPGKV